MAAQVIAKKQRGLLAKTSMAANMNVRAFRARLFPKISLRKIRITRAPYEATSFEPNAKPVDGLEGSDGDLDIDHGLGCKSRNRR
jgi:hypothetical protein